MQRILKTKDIVKMYGLSKQMTIDLLNSLDCPIIERKKNGMFLIFADDFENWFRAKRKNCNDNKPYQSIVRGNRDGAIPDSKGIYKWEDQNKLVIGDKYYSKKNRVMVKKI